jgi:Histidine kinase-, DNA gyrase B-, and HSP90-like ATPase
MSETDQRLQFEASAYLQRLIGRELISTEELAIIEFVKNSYDAGARHVVITICPQSEKEPGEITIRDDGTGMALPDLRRVFMVAGYSERPDEVDTAPRVPTGEKGIGRFAADKLGHELLVITKPSGAKRSLYLDINWDDFESRKKRLNEITAPYSYRVSPELANVDSGTFLRITRLRRRWDHALINRLRQSLADLLDPFNAPRDFEIDIQVPGSLKLTGPITPPTVARSDIELSFKVLKNGKVKQSLRSPALNLGN